MERLQKENQNVFPNQTNNRPINQSNKQTNKQTIKENKEAKNQSIQHDC